MWQALVARGWTGPQFNAWLHLPDATLPASRDVHDESGVRLEGDRTEQHFAVGTTEATVRRHAAMTTAGLARLHVPPIRIRADPQGVVEEFPVTFFVVTPSATCQGPVRSCGPRRVRRATGAGQPTAARPPTPTPTTGSRVGCVATRDALGEDCGSSERR